MFLPNPTDRPVSYMQFICSTQLWWRIKIINASGMLCCSAGTAPHPRVFLLFFSRFIRLARCPWPLLAQSHEDRDKRETRRSSHFAISDPLGSLYISTNLISCEAKCRDRDTGWICNSQSESNAPIFRANNKLGISLATDPVLLNVADLLVEYSALLHCNGYIACTPRLAFPLVRAISPKERDETINLHVWQLKARFI